jgi:O-methyltransferase domain
LESGQVRIEGHDYFQENPFRGDIYFCRGVLRDYDDEEALKFLSWIIPALRENPKSRIIFNEIVVPTDIVDKSKLLLAPSQYISATQSSYQRAAHLQTMNTWTLFGGKERTFEQFRVLFDKAGLKLEKFYKFSIFTVMMECCLA